MSQCNLFAFHTMFNLLYSGGGGIRGLITGCGLLLHCMNKVGVYCVWVLGYVANPWSARAELYAVVSDGASMGFTQGSLWEKNRLYPWSTWSAAWERGEEEGDRANEDLKALLKHSKTGKCLHSKSQGSCTGQETMPEPRSQSGPETLISVPTVRFHRREGRGSSLCYLSTDVGSTELQVNRRWSLKSIKV